MIKLICDMCRREISIDEGYYIIEVVYMKPYTKETHLQEETEIIVNQKHICERCYTIRESLIWQN